VGTKETLTDLIIVEIVCGSITSGSLSVPPLTINHLSNQQYLPGATDVGWISPKHVNANPVCQLDTYQMISSDDVTNRETCTLKPKKYKIRRTSLESEVIELTNYQCENQNDDNRIWSRTGKSLT